jgi:hypothetical protein
VLSHEESAELERRMIKKLLKLLARLRIPAPALA